MKGITFWSETKAPTGYLLDTTLHPFDVTAQLGKEQPIALGDLINYQGTAQLTKETETGLQVRCLRSLMKQGKP